MHMMWNVLIVGGIIHFGDTADVYSFYSYVMSTRSLLISGGAFGVEASVISVRRLYAFWLLGFYFDAKAGKPGRV